MANSKYEYVKKFERHDALLPASYIMIRLDGRGFHRLSTVYGFERPNDRRGLELMNAAAEGVLNDIPEIVLSYGVSDEYSFVFYRDTTLFDRRESKLISTVASTFTAQYLMNWGRFFPGTCISSPLPTFDARAVVYPSPETLKDYMRWRQVDCHINNLYNTTFWTLVQKGALSNRDAEKRLKGTLAADKNEILFAEFGINYNNEPEIFRKGSVMYRDLRADETSQPEHEVDQEQAARKISKRKKVAQIRSQRRIVTEHTDIIKEGFWEQRPWLLA